MAMYFHGGSELQAAASADGTTMQTLYLMNPSTAYVPFSDTPNQLPNMLFLNPAATPHALSSAAFTHAPLPASMLPHSSEDPGRPSYLWGINMEQSSPAGSPSGVRESTTWQLGLRQPAPAPAPAAPSPRTQGLSLSLLENSSTNHNNNNNSINQMGQPLMQGVGAVSGNSPSSTSVSAVSNCVVLRSKYLRAAQELLEEVVSVGKGIIKSGDVSTQEGTKHKIKTSIKEPMGDQNNSRNSPNNDKRTAELTTAQRQDLHMRKAKLLTMLDEVEQRYRQYHQQMQTVVSTFEQAAGWGSARSYTSVALQTISRQFRCLKDAIEGQIKATSKRLGEEECMGAKLEGSRLRFVDQQLRQQRALQQLGMMHQNAWRPQRGLPERAVSVLRAWLFEHFLHPYPKDSDKALLAKQTGLTRSQVSNWFINARVRLWKPMVEEMYLEEMKEQEKKGAEDPNPNPNSTETNPKEQYNTRKPESERPGNPTTSQKMNSSRHEFSSSTISSSPLGGPLQQPPDFTLIGSSDPDRILQPSPKKPRGSGDMQSSLNNILSSSGAKRVGAKFGDHERLLVAGTTSHSGSYGGYALEQLAAPSFHGNGSVSLTLGLPHCENLSLSGNQHSFLSSHHNIQLARRLELGPADSDFCGINSAPASHSGAGTGYQNMELQNRTKEFAAQLLPDFVA